MGLGQRARRPTQTAPDVEQMGRGIQAQRLAQLQRRLAATDVELVHPRQVRRGKRAEVLPGFPQAVGDPGCQVAACGIVARHPVVPMGHEPRIPASRINADHFTISRRICAALAAGSEATAS